MYGYLFYGENITSGTGSNECQDAGRLSGDHRVIISFKLSNHIARSKDRSTLGRAGKRKKDAFDPAECWAGHNGLGNFLECFYCVVPSTTPSCLEAIRVQSTAFPI
jgi:hypothetical protein